MRSIILCAHPRFLFSYALRSTLQYNIHPRDTPLYATSLCATPPRDTHSRDFPPCNTLPRDTSPRGTPPRVWKSHPTHLRIQASVSASLPSPCVKVPPNPPTDVSICFRLTPLLVCESPTQPTHGRKHFFFISSIRKMLFTFAVYISAFR